MPRLTEDTFVLYAVYHDLDPIHSFLIFPRMRVLPRHFPRRRHHTRHNHHSFTCNKPRILLPYSTEELLGNIHRPPPSPSPRASGASPAGVPTHNLPRRFALPERPPHNISISLLQGTRNLLLHLSRGRCPPDLTRKVVISLLLYPSRGRVEQRPRNRGS